MKTAAWGKPETAIHDKTDRGELANIFFYGLLLVIIFEYFRPNHYLPVLNVFKISSVLPVTLFLISFFSGKGPHIGSILRERNTKLLLFFLFLLLLSIVTADVTFYSYQTFVVVFGYCLVFFSARKLLTNIRRFRLLFGCYILAHVMIALLNPAVFLNPEGRNYITSTPFLGDGNDFALSVCMVIPMVYFFITTEKRKSLRILFILTLVFMSLCVIGTQSRGGTIALCLSGLYLWSKSRKKFVGIALVTLLLVVGLIYAPPQYFERMDRIANYEEDGSAQGRLLAWGSAVRMALDHPVLGVGSGHFFVKYGTEYRPPGYGSSDLPWQTAHSVYFLVLGELGFPGLFFILFFLISNFVDFERKIKILRGSDPPRSPDTEQLLVSLSGSLLAFSVGGLFLSVLYYPHIYFLAGMLGAALQLSVTHGLPDLREETNFAFNKLHPGSNPRK